MSLASLDSGSIFKLKMLPGIKKTFLTTNAPRGKKRGALTMPGKNVQRASVAPGVASAIS